MLKFKPRIVEKDWETASNAAGISWHRGGLELLLHSLVEADLVVHPADVAAAVPRAGPHNAEDWVPGEQRGRGGERLLRPRHWVHLEPGVGGQGLPPGQAGQVNSPALCHPVDSTDSVWLAQTGSWALCNNDIANLK